MSLGFLPGNRIPAALAKSSPPVPGPSIELTVVDTPVETASSTLRETRADSFFVRAATPTLCFFLLWGLYTAFFIPTGWAPDTHFMTAVGPGILSLLPFILAYLGGSIVFDTSGAVVSTFFTLGLMTGVQDFNAEKAATDAMETAVAAQLSETATAQAVMAARMGAQGHPMVAESLLLSPLAALLLYYILMYREPLKNRLPARPWIEELLRYFETAVVIFYGLGMTLLAFVAYGPISDWLVTALGDAAKASMDAWLPLGSIFVEPAKLLFMNNAINHGVLQPRGMADVAADGSSKYFLVETNPGPGLGLLLAMWWTGGYASPQFARVIRCTAPLAIIVHFFGGIHEIYFIYALIRPRLLIALILSGLVGVAIFDWGNGGLSAPPSPGSLFAYMDLTPSDKAAAVYTGLFVSALVSALLSWALLRAQCAWLTQRVSGVFTSAA